MGGFFFISGQIRKIKRADGRPGPSGVAPPLSLLPLSGCGLLKPQPVERGATPLERGPPTSALNLPDLARDKKKSTHFATLCFGQSKF